MENNWLTRLRHSFLQINLFKKAESTNETFHLESLSTLIYLLSVIVSLITGVIITGFIARPTSKIEFLPTQSNFERLLQQYPDTLKCPCSRLAILYDTFVTTNIEFHQICSSKFVTQAWIDLVYIQNNSSLV